MATQKQYLDYAGLSSYDALLKTYIDSVKTKAVKAVIWDEVNEKISFYKDPDAKIEYSGEGESRTSTITYADGSRIAEISISSKDVKDLKARVGMSAALNAYQSKSNLTEIVNVLTADDETAGSVAKLIKTAINALDTAADIALATETDGVVTIKAIKEVDGIIAASTDTTKDVTLAKVATTGTAADVAVVDADGKFAATNVETALNEVKVEADTNKADIATLNGNVETTGSVLKMIKDNAKDATYDSTHTLATKIAEVASQASVKVVKNETATEGYLASYHVEQNGTQVGATINIPKDYLVKSAQLKTVETADVPYSGAKVGDKYLDFVINTKDASVTDEHIYIPVNDLFDSYTSGSAATDAVVVVVDNDTNKISATVTDGTIARAKIDATFESDIAKLEGTHAAGAKTGTYKTVAQEVTDGINTLDATKEQVANPADADGTGLALKVVEEDGKITSIEGSIATISSTQINGLFPA